MEFSGFVNPWLCPLHGCQGTRASSLPTALEPGRTFIDVSVPGILNYLFCQWEASHAAVAQCMSTAQDQEKSQIERDKLWVLIQVSKTREQGLQIISKPSTGSHPTACSAAQGHPQGINRSFVPLILIGAPRLCDQVQRQWLGKVSPRYSTELSTEREREREPPSLRGKEFPLLHLLLCSHLFSAERLWRYSPVLHHSLFWFLNLLLQ